MKSTLGLLMRSLGNSYSREETFQGHTASEQTVTQSRQQEFNMKTHFRWLASATAVTLASLTMATSTSFPTDTISKIVNYKQWTQVTRDWPAELVKLDGLSIGG